MLYGVCVRLLLVPDISYHDYLGDCTLAAVLFSTEEFSFVIVAMTDATISPRSVLFSVCKYNEPLL